MKYRVKIKSGKYTLKGNFCGDSQIDCIRKAIKEWQKRIEKKVNISSVEPPIVEAWLI